MHKCTNAQMHKEIKKIKKGNNRKKPQNKKPKTNQQTNIQRRNN